jgi:hypothetical protein
MEHAMTDSEQKPEPGADSPNVFHEADIGSGERSPGQQETDEMIKAIPTVTSDGRPDNQEGQAAKQ